MGAWGYGLLSSDDAYDAIALFEDDIARVATSQKGLVPLLEKVARKSRKDFEYVLAVAETLLAQGVAFGVKSQRFLLPYLGAALLEASVYDDPTKRVLALGRFAQRLVGVEVDAKVDNPNLIEKIFQSIKSRQ